ncbi:MAG: hypothetical protein GY795_45645 [Desulfobacterales bacterium]|nr:hypothetical protein [Desulfobacterales bacterium]
MKSFNFWQKWLLIFGIYLSVFGIVLAFFSNSTFMDFLFNHQIDPVFWGDATLQNNELSFRSWIYGVLGSVISGWGVAIAFIAHYAFKKKQKWAWKCILTGTIIWFLPDTIMTVKYGVGFNIFFNISMLVLMLLPLLFTYKQFYSKN